MVRSAKSTTSRVVLNTKQILHPNGAATMNLEEIAQPKQAQQPAQPPQAQTQQVPQPTQQPAQQQPKSMKIQNVTKVVVTNNGKVALVQLHGAGEQMHYVKLPPGDVLQLHLVTPKVVHIAEK